MTTVGGGAFNGCSGLVSLSIPARVQSVGDGAFAGCSNLTIADMNIGLKTIGSGAFSGCTELVYAVIPDGVTSIGSSAFEGCKKLSSASIPASVTNVGSDVFMNTEWYYNQEGDFLYLDHWLLSGYATDVVVDVGTRGIAGSAFRGGYGIRSVKIPNSVKFIGEEAFYWCADMTTIDIGTGLERVEKDAFYGCSSLITVNIHDLSAWCETDFAGCSANPTDVAHGLYLNGEELHRAVIPEGTARIGDLAFLGCVNLTSVSIPASVESIGDCAFENCYGLESVDIAEGLTSVGMSAFYNCTSLKALMFPNSLTLIDDFAFSYCSELTTVQLGKGLTDMGRFCFEDCKKLEDVISLNSTPPAFLKKETYQNVNPLYGIGNYRFSFWVPKGSKSAYAATTWNTLNIKEMKPGDADLSGEVNDNDLNAVAGFVMGRETPGFYRSLSDLNGDNKVDAADVVELVNQKQ